MNDSYSPVGFRVDSGGNITCDVTFDLINAKMQIIENKDGVLETSTLSLNEHFFGISINDFVADDVDDLRKKISIRSIDEEPTEGFIKFGFKQLSNSRLFMRILREGVFNSMWTLTIGTEDTRIDRESQVGMGLFNLESSATIYIRAEFEDGIYKYLVYYSSI